MQTLRRSTRVALGATALLVALVALVAAGCAGGHGQLAGATATATPTPLAATSATATPPTSIASPATTNEPSVVPTQVATSAAAGPIATPDFAAIEALIKDIKDELGADASAGADEGSTP